MKSELYHWGILGMKWGLRRYQNEDGSLTDAGKRRYQRDKSANDRKKSKDRAEESTLENPDRWVREDMETARQITTEGERTIRRLQEVERNTRQSSSKTEKIDLSEMDDETLRKKINRELLEQQYNRVMNQVHEDEVSKGRAIVKEVFDVAGGVMALGTSALTIALSINQLRGK